MGGTTTDVAIVVDGRPVIRPEGAVIAGWRTMVEAIDVRTCGLGGDSEVYFDRDGRLMVGPRKAMPLSLLADQFPDVLVELRKLAGAERLPPFAARFAFRNPGREPDAQLVPARAARLGRAHPGSAPPRRGRPQHPGRRGRATIGRSRTGERLRGSPRAMRCTCLAGSTAGALRRRASAPRFSPPRSVMRARASNRIRRKASVSEPTSTSFARRRASCSKAHLRTTRELKPSMRAGDPWAS